MNFCFWTIFYFIFFIISINDNILFFTSAGRVYRKKGYQIPEASRTAKGSHINNILNLEENEKVTTMLHGREYEEDGYLFMVTRNGTVKRTEKSQFRNIRASGLRVLTLDEGDELITVEETDGKSNILIATTNGMSICFKESDVRPMGRTAVGVRGIRLKEKDHVVGAAKVTDDDVIVMVTENGYGKRTLATEYFRGRNGDELQSRGGYGVKGYQVTEKTGLVTGIGLADDADDILLISNDGTMIRMAVTDINIYSRSAQGVRTMKVSDGSKVISMTLVRRDDTDDTEE